MATLKELNSQLAAAQKKHGAKSQAAGRIQYKINQLNKDSKGTVVRTKDGKAVKSKTGVVRQKDATKKKRKPAVQKLTMDRNPNTVVKKKAGPDMYKQAVALDNTKSKVNKVTVTPYKAPPKIKDLSANKRAELVRKQGSPSGAAASLKLREKNLAAKKEAKRQNDAIDKIANASDKDNRPKLARNAYKARLNQVEIGRLKQKQKIDAENAKAKAKKLAAKKAADKKEQDRLDKQKKQKKIQSAYKKTVEAVLSSRKRRNNSGL